MLVVLVAGSSRNQKAHYDEEGTGNQSLGGAVSNHALSPRLVAVMAVPLAAALACASHGPKDTTSSSPRYSTDTSTVLNTDGKSLQDLFGNRFPGVTVSQAPGGGLHIKIRGGSNTFYGSDDPLIVVDETPLPQITGGIVDLNPNDIAKIEVLKNPADIGIYGIRGGNGVVKITTKRPGRPPS